MGSPLSKMAIHDQPCVIPYYINLLYFYLGLLKIILLDIKNIKDNEKNLKILAYLGTSWWFVG